MSKSSARRSSSRSPSKDEQPESILPRDKSILPRDRGMGYSKVLSAKQDPVHTSKDVEAGSTPTDEMLAKRLTIIAEKPWFQSKFLEAALNQRLDQSTGVSKQNPTPTLFILVGPSSVGKSSVKQRLFPEMNGYVVNVDVDEIKLYGNEKLLQHPNPNKSGEMLSDIEGIQFHYDLVLDKLLPMVLKTATDPGPGQYKNIILDTTGSMRDQIIEYISATQQSYTVKVIIVYSEKMQCLQRVKERNTQLFQSGQGTRYIPPRAVSSIYDTFLKKNQAYFYAIGELMPRLTNELILVDNRSTIPRIVARRTRSELQIFPYVMGEDSIVDVDGAFYGLTLIPPEGGQPASIVQGDLQSQIQKAQREWTEFDIAEKTAAAAAKAAEATTGIGGSRKRRVSRRRLHGSRVRKTVKKYYRPSTRRRRHQRRHSHRRGYS